MNADLSYFYIKKKIILILYITQISSECGVNHKWTHLALRNDVRNEFNF